MPSVHMADRSLIAILLPWPREGAPCPACEQQSFFAVAFHSLKGLVFSGGDEMFIIVAVSWKIGTLHFLHWDVSTMIASACDNL